MRSVFVLSGGGLELINKLSRCLPIDKCLSLDLSLLAYLYLSIFIATFL